MLKKHPYRKIALSIRHWNLHKSNVSVQILGLSASLTYDIHDSTVEKTLSRLCDELSTEIMHSPTDDELIKGGYAPQQNNTEVIHSRRYVPELVLPECDR